MKRLFVIAFFCLPVSVTHADMMVYNQPPSANGGLLQSSWWNPIGSDYDQCVWNEFTLNSDQDITEIGWRGGFDPLKFGSGGPVLDFLVAIYASIPSGTQPNVVAPSLAEYWSGGNAGQTPAGTFGGAAMYDYKFLLPTPFPAAAGTHYWLQIVASQNGIPDWGLATGTGGYGLYFREIVGAGDVIYQSVPGNAAFTLYAVPEPSSLCLLLLGAMGLIVRRGVTLRHTLLN